MTTPETFSLPRPEQRETRVGPRGGNLDNPKTHPARREASYEPQIFPDGTVGPHKHGGFHNSARVGIQTEQPWHTMAAYMLLAGRTNSEIAVAAGVGVSAVSNLRGQLWFQQRLANLTNDTGEAIVGLIKSEAIASIEKVVELRDSQNERVALAASTFLIDQAHGKAVQKVITENTHRAYASPQDELDATLADLENIRRARARTLSPDGKDGSEAPVLPAESSVVSRTDAGEA